MKKSILAIVVFAFTFLFSNDISAQKFSKLDPSPMDAETFPSSHREANKIIKVTYSRPQLKGRAVEKLAPYGKVWRTGANEAVEITFYEAVVFGGENVKAGTYTLFTIPGEKEWTVILSTASNVWGSYFYKEIEDVVRVKAAVSKTKKFVEAFSMKFDKKMNLHMGWGDVLVTIPITK